MGFLSALKSFFGFGPATDSGADAELLADSTPSADEQRPEPVAVEVSPPHREAIFEHVVEVFNASLPNFLAGSVDPEAQKRMLFEAMDQGLKDYIESLDEANRAVCEANWQQRQDSMNREMESVRKRSEEVEQRASEFKQQQLSADRQKRALSERVNDLEQKLASAQAESEQYELENRSLLNRVKVAAVQAEDLEKLRAEADALRARLDEVLSSPEAAAASVRKSYEAEIEKLTEANESLKEQTRVASEMFEDMRRRHREAVAEADELRNRQQTVLDEINSTVARFEEFESDLSSARAEAKDLRRRLAAREAEIKTLKDTVAENLHLQAEREAELKREIDQLRPPTVVAEMTVEFGPAEEESPRISEDDLTAMEETFESGEWFTNAPPPDTPSMRPPESATDFGYQNPTRKKTGTENPAQLSLF